MKTIEAIGLEDIRTARLRIEGLAARTPLVRLGVDDAEIYLKLENLQPIGSFKLRGALNAMLRAGYDAIAGGVWTPSAGNMAQGVAWAARELGVSCTAVVPDHAPQTKLDAIARLGARSMRVPFATWWRTIQTGEPPPESDASVRDAFLVHPVVDTGVIAGNGTIGIEILEDLPDVDAVLVPYGGGGLSAGIASAVRVLRPEAHVYACEVETAAPFAAALAAGEPVVIERTRSFVDGIGSQNVLAPMWPLVRELLRGSLVVSLEQVQQAVRFLVERSCIVAEGAGATPVAAALAGKAGQGKLVCVVSGGNIDTAVLAKLLLEGNS